MAPTLRGLSLVLDLTILTVVADGQNRRTPGQS